MHRVCGLDQHVYSWFSCNIVLHNSLLYRLLAKFFEAKLWLKLILCEDKTDSYSLNVITYMISWGFMSTVFNQRPRSSKLNLCSFEIYPFACALIDIGLNLRKSFLLNIESDTVCIGKAHNSVKILLPTSFLCELCETSICLL